MKIKLPSFLEMYKRIRKPAAPHGKVHGKKKYSKADRREDKKEIDKELRD